MCDDDINILLLAKAEERYLFLFDDANRLEMLRTLGRFAANPELSFTWYDAATLSQKVRAISPGRFAMDLVVFGWCGRG